MRKLLLLSLLSVFFSPLWADVFPKPEMEFSFIYNTADKPLLDPQHSEQIQCQDNQCMESKPLGKYGIQKLYCSLGNCFSVAYEYAPFQKLIISFADGSKKESNVFSTQKKLRSRFNVYVDEENLTVEPSPLSPAVNAWERTDAWISLLIILLLELLAAAAFLTYTQKRFSILYSVALANILTTAGTWLLLARLASETLFLWICCLLAEAFLIYFMNRKTLSARESFMLSLAMNVTSYSLGLILSFWVAPYLF